MSKKSSNKMWGGRFSTGPDAIMEAINASIEFDKRLAPEDIESSLAHAEMLAETGIINLPDANAIKQGLEEILAELEAGDLEFSTALEDIHMNIESRLKDKIGEPAGRLHTARSRNDQVATDFRLWVRGQIDLIDQNLVNLIRALLDQAQSGISWIMPGFTHLQTAQPITWGHHMMAYVEMFARDRSRLKDARARMNECPLGSAALAGTSFPIEFSTGSSIMPQKKNPDAAELVRAKIGRILGANIGLMTVMKGLPLAYSKDMQEDKEQVFDAADSLRLALCAMEGMIKDLTANKESLEKAAKSGFSTATDLADWLVRVLNLPFREAHHITGELVRLAEQLECDLSELKLKDMQKVHSDITEDVFTVLSIENSVKSRSSYGGTCPEEVQFQIDRWKKELE
ncbi:MAG: argininosuccinate lyase [Rhodobacterales bacterium]|nr:argininosuccinate lyase [Rhodobacterales bacterium]